MGVARAAAGMMRRRRTIKFEEPMEPDPDEQELRMFESNCHLLNTKQYKGLRRVKVEIWLLFEDQTSSVYAKITQASLMLLIVFSTILILVQSYGRCKWVSEPAEGRPLDELPGCTGL